MTFVSYAQNFEDVVLWRALNEVKGGRYLDIGAHDPIVDSVSFAFYEAGWRGMHVEPTPARASRLRAARPDEPVIEAAVTDSPGPILFYELDGLSSGSEKIAEHHIASGHKPRRMLVPTVRLDRLLSTMGPDIHWLKIDVEGMETDVLRSWGDCDVRPWVLVIEATFPNSRDRMDHLWSDQLLRRGYEGALFDGLSCYFVHEAHRDLAPRLSSPANVFDAFSVTAGHFSAGNMRAELELLRDRLEAERSRTDQLAQELTQARKSERIHAAAESRLREMKAAADASRVEIATLEERSAQLKNKLDRADQSLRQSDERVTGLEQQLAEARVAAVRMEKDRDEARLRFELQSADNERLRSALVETHRILRTAAERSAGIRASINNWMRVAQSGSARSDLAEAARLIAALVDTPMKSITARVEDRELVDAIVPALNCNPYLRAESLAELLSWDDLNFVRCAYVTILGRQPDEQGETYYARRIRSGYSKMQLLWQLRNSDEAERHNPGIAGLDRALRRARRARMPLVGALFRLFNHEEGDSAGDRRGRALANEMALLRAGQALALNEMRGLSSGLHALQTQIQGFDGRLSGGASVGSKGGAASQHMRGLLDPIDLDSSRTADEAIEILKGAINKSREVTAFRSGSASIQ